MEYTQSGRLESALSHQIDREAVYAREREKSRKHNLKYAESIQASLMKRRAMPKHQASSRARARIGQLLKHDIFKTGQYPPSCAKSGSRQHVISLHDLLGATASVVKIHIEGQFSSGMSWLNYGSRWHIGHKTPVRKFDCSDPAQLKACFYYANLQPELAEENYRRMNEESL